MKADTIPHAESGQALVKVLMDFYAAPGSYAPNLGQPALIFKQSDMVIAWAQGKINAEQASQNAMLQQAAIYFVQRAFLRQEGTHYDVMGLGREFSLDALRLRYRALISLTHPDKNISGLANDAAVRINKAYDTLRDVDKRVHYDSTNSVEPSAMSRQAKSLSSSYYTDKFELSSHRPAYIPTVNKLVFYSIPILAVLFVVAIVAISQNKTDLQLVEISSSSKSSVSKPADSVRSELPQLAASLYADLTESGRKWLLHNESIEPLASAHANTNLNLTSNANVSTNANLNVSVNRTLSENANRHQFRGKAIDELQPMAVFGSSDIGSDTSNVPGVPVFSKVPDIETARVIPALVEPVNQLRLKMPSGIPVMSESTAHFPQLNEARFLVTQLISALERPKDAEIMQNKMTSQGVSGNLFGVALPHLRQSGAIRIDQLVLKEKLENNRLVMNGSVALWLGASANQLLPYKYAVNVEFKNVESGPVMSSFDLKEAR